MEKLISVIMPLYNKAKFVKDAIQSVLDQTYSQWELLVINDGSTDNSLALIEEFSDPRIRLFSQTNQGASAARNIGLREMRGEFFCFLDADDALTPESLMVRLEMFESDPTLGFVDGKVLVMDCQLHVLRRSWSPQFYGNPFHDLVSLTGRSFFGLTWMIKRQRSLVYRMNEQLTHSEDLFFYMLLSRTEGLYAYTKSAIMLYRDSPDSAMKNLKGLERGYRLVYDTIKEWVDIDKRSLAEYRQKTKRIMFRSYLKKGMIYQAWKIRRCWL